MYMRITSSTKNACNSIYINLMDWIKKKKKKILRTNLNKNFILSIYGMVDNIASSPTQISYTHDEDTS
jgi:hypothetical protein